MRIQVEGPLFKTKNIELPINKKKRLIPVLGQLPSGQLPSGQLPSGQLPSGQLPSRTVTIRTVTLRAVTLRSIYYYPVVFAVVFVLVSTRVIYTFPFNL